MSNLSDNITRKFVESYDLADYEIWTDTGWEDITQVHKTVEYSRWYLKTESGKYIEAADDHIIFDSQLNEIFVKDCVPNQTKILTEDGPETVTECYDTGIIENMFDVTVSGNHRFYGNGILSHNTTTAVCIILHYVLFNEHKTVGLLANKGDAAREILERIQIAYEALPEWLSQGIVEWNKGSIRLENGCKIIASATSSSAIRGKSVSLLYIDETAFVESWEEFAASVLPTLSSGVTTKLLYTSTPNGLNHFHSICQGAEEGKNGFEFIRVTWDRVPGRGEEWKKEALDTLNGDLEKFAQEYECQFLGSSGTLISGDVLKALVRNQPISQRDGLTIYETPIEGHSYCLTGDVSEGKNLDYSAFNVIDITRMPYKQVAVFRNNLIPPAEYADVIYTTANMYNESAVLVENNNSMGNEVNGLLFNIGYENLIYTENAGARGKRVSNNPKKAEIGVRTTQNTKAKGCSILKLLIEQQQLIIQDHNTIHELSRFSRKGRSYEAEPGATDDIVMSLVLFAWLTGDDYFKGLTDLDTVARLRERDQQEIEEQFIQMGYAVTGAELYEDSSSSVPVVVNPLDYW
jgi:hypothetical protein